MVWPNAHKKRLLTRLVVTVLLFSCEGLATYNPLHEAKTSFGSSYIFNPVATPLLENQEKETLNPQWSFGLGLEAPIYDYLNAGFFAQIALGVGSQDAASTARLIELNGVIKPLIPIVTRIGYMAPYISLPIGLSVATGSPFVYVGPGPSPSNRPGIGVNATAALGFDYFPIPTIGVYVEGAYRAVFLAYRELDESGQSAASWNYTTYMITGFGINFGLRISL